MYWQLGEGLSKKIGMLSGACDTQEKILSVFIIVLMVLIVAWCSKQFDVSKKNNGVMNLTTLGMLEVVKSLVLKQVLSSPPFANAHHF